MRTQGPAIAMPSLQVSTGNATASLATSRVAPAAPAQRLAPLADRARHVSFARGAAIFRDGDAADRIYEVRNGVVRLSKTLADGRRQVLDFVEPDRIIGLHDGKVHGATAEAVTPAVLVSYPRSSVETAMAGDAATACRLMTELRAAAMRSEVRLVLVGRKTADERVATFLLMRAHRDAADGEEVSLPMGRADIADYLAVTIETVSRALSKFKAGGLIAMPGPQSIVLRDIERLRDVAGL
ncbi:MAG: helix-turn-helix domain-containing protein [Alphaproteobacteria bacterium]|nr:helix-turn-helix domain-containing protein [Alphaproteobacteria bacterium]